MCVCASETSRPRLFNWVTVMLVSAWVLIVSAVAHSIPSVGVKADKAGQDIAFVEATMMELLDRLATILSGI